MVDGVKYLTIHSSLLLYQIYINGQQLSSNCNYKKKHETYNDNTEAAAAACGHRTLSVFV